MKLYTVLGVVKKTGLCTAFVQLYLDGERIVINTKVQVDPNSFDLARGQIRGKSLEIKDKNLMIEQCRSRIHQIEVKYRLKNKELTPDQFKNEYSHPSYDIDFLAWMETEIKLLKNQVGASRIIKYTTILNKLKEFRDPISFSEIDRFFIEDFRGWCKTKKGNDISTVSTNLNVIKVFTNRAKRKDLIEIDPFLDIKIGRAKPDRTFCSEEELTLLSKMYKGDPERPLKAHLIPVLRHFLFMALTGLRISDFTDITFDHIANGSLRFYPIKTRSKKKSMVKIPLCQQAVKLILDEGNTVGKLFHPCTEQRMNTNIKAIAAIAGIKKPLTNHSARHTFATLFIKKTSDVATLQRLLGHSRIEETMVYVHITEENLILQMKRFEDGLSFDLQPTTKKQIPAPEPVPLSLN
jgi:integrase/recombinase XerD